jgi:hypothetical protein
MLVTLIVGALVLIFISAALAPMESLGWWAGWGGKAPGEKDIGGLTRPPEAEAIPEAEHYIVYLSGIGAISGTSIPDEEYPFLGELKRRLPTTKVIDDVYPYSVTNSGLTGQRAFARTWRWIEGLRLKNPNSMLAMIVNLRNIFQLFVSADRRYGPIYNLGIANEIWRGLLRHGYRPGNGKPITLIGWSGGGQIAIGSVTYLASVPAPIRVISLGGMLSDDIGFNRVNHLWHLFGEKDQLQALGQRLFAGRWSMMPKSPWNRALAAGKITMIPLGPYNHNGKENYFDMESKLPDGRSFGEKTLDTIRGVLVEAAVIPPEAALPAAPADAGAGAPAASTDAGAISSAATDGAAPSGDAH